MFPIYYRSRDNQYYVDVTFTNDWGPFKRGEHYDKLVIDTFDNRILTYRHGEGWRNGVPFAMSFDSSRSYPCEQKSLKAS